MSPKASDLQAEAAEILRSVDERASALNQSVLESAREGDQARQNARKAAALARRYANPKMMVSHRHHQTTSPTQNKNSSPKAALASPQRLSTQAKFLNQSLELERCQRALAEEKAAHKETQKELTQVQSIANKRQEELESLLQDQETLRHEFARKNDELQAALDLTKKRLESADQDATLALELAQNNSVAREEMEAWYQQCLEQNTQLQLQMEAQQLQLEGVETQPLISNESMQNETNALVHMESEKMHKPDAMVASGRELLKSFRSGRVVVASPSKAAERSHERRRQLNQRLQALDEAPTAAVQHAQSEASGIQHRMTKVLQESGRRLSLPGRWWNNKTSTTESKTVASPEDAESLTQHYCQAVENLVERKDKDLSELQAYCELMDYGDGASKK